MLAAGAGRRFGGGKLLAPLRGRPLIGHVLALVAEARREGLIVEALVTHAEGDRSVAGIAREFGFVAVPVGNADLGLAESLRAGFAALPAGDAVLLLLGDQPAVSLATVQALLGAVSRVESSLVRPRYDAGPDAPGHPVLVGREHWGLALAATGDRGLDPVLAERGLRWTEVPVEGGNPDVDTTEDLERLS